MTIIDPTFLKDDKLNWEGFTNAVNATALKNLLKLEKNALKFSPDGLNIYTDWIKSKLDYSLNSFTTWLQVEATQKGYAIEELTAKVKPTGELNIDIKLSDGELINQIIEA